eukprot:CAMPEP_0173082628 /NCGR_PEP_ID=MMETSP1102-20130122/18487_1 /TAXON_ID=49646 /ORGANISM="Geminigera sp., Strain Caron Lab Isolate" /LENGTH=160 /DNA_ID=CAMNT_0013958447 /DNA_START=74 /DNA_END=556 /DNA_ORIENTATION=-
MAHRRFLLMAARTELRTLLHHLRSHFAGRHGAPTGDMRPYAKFLTEAVKTNKEAKDSDLLLKDLASYSYYLSALVDKKRLLSTFGGDSVRGITAHERIENTSNRVGLKLPKGSFQNSSDQESMTARAGLRPGESKPTLKSLREDVNTIVATGGVDPNQKK